MTSLSNNAMETLRTAQDTGVAILSAGEDISEWVDELGLTRISTVASLDGAKFAGEMVQCPELLLVRGADLSETDWSAWDVDEFFEDLCKWEACTWEGAKLPEGVVLVDGQPDLAE